METRVVKVSRDAEEDAKAVFESRVRLRFTMKRSWLGLFGTVFRVTGPSSVIDAAVEEIRDIEAKIWQAAQW